MKVLHVVSNISIRSGIMSVLMNYYRNIDTTEVQFGFMYFDERPETYEEEIRQLGGEIFKIDRVTKFFDFYGKLNKLCKERYGEYHILHIHDLFMTAFFVGIKKKAGIKKIIIHSHATKFSDHKIGEIRNRIFSQANRFVPDYYFACSRIAGQTAFGKRFDREGVVINNAISIERFYPDVNLNKVVKRELGIEDKFVIGHVGNFAPAKNHLFLIDIFEQTLKRIGDAVLVLVGDGTLREQVFLECKKRKIESNILYLGTRTDVNRIMHCFDKFLFPSIYEGLGIALIEAQCTGVPCVFSDVVPVEANILFEYNRVLSLNDSIDRWVEAVLENVKPNVENVTQRIESAGYSIKTEALKMQKKYQEILLTDL